MTSKILNKFKDKTWKQIKDRRKYEERINKSLYYVKYPEIDCLSLPLTELATEIFSETRRGQSLDRLHYSDAVQISWHACVSPLAFVMAAVYLDRLKKSNPEYIQNVPSSELFLVSLMISYKFMCDDGDFDQVFMDEWASSGSISVKELIQLEKDFLKAIDWRVFIKEENFWKKLTQVEILLAKRQGTSRGFFTYTELEKLSMIFELTRLIDCFWIFLSCIAVYLSTIIVIFGAVTTTTTIISMSSIHSIPDPSVHMVAVQQELDEPIDILSQYISNSCVNEFGLTEFCNNESNVSLYHDVIENNVQNVSWDWWTIPSLNWLFETSQLMNRFDTMNNFNINNDFVGIHSHLYQNNGDDVEIMQKGTKTRIQDQMEGSWHKEWTDTIFKEFLDYTPQQKVIHLEL